MAAMRLGCVFSQAANIGYLHKAQSPYSVNTLAVLAATEAIRDTEYIANYVAEVLAAREICSTQGFDRLEAFRTFAARPTSCCSRPGARAIEVRDKLRDMGVLVRDRSYELAGCVRVTVGTREQIGRFLAALEEIW